MKIGNLVKSFGNGIIKVIFETDIVGDVLAKIIEMGFPASEVIIASSNSIYALLDEGLPIGILEARNIDDDEMKEIVQLVEALGSDRFRKRVALTKKYVDSLYEKKT